jgi:hypothetical protein
MQKVEGAQAAASYPGGSGRLCHPPPGRASDGVQQPVNARDIVTAWPCSPV